MGSSGFREIIFNLSGIYIVCTVIPVVTLTVTFSLFFTTEGHYGSYGFIPTMSETVVFFPENRIFLVGMSVTAAFMTLYFFFRNHLLISIREKEPFKKNKVLRIVHGAMWVLSIIIPLSLILLAACPVNVLFIPHMMGAFGFFICGNLYFLLNCFFFAKTQPPLNFVTLIPNLLSIVLMVLCFALRPPNKNPSKTQVEISSFFQYGAGLLLVLSFSLTLHRMPRHGIRISQSI